MTNETGEHWAAQTDRFNFEDFAADKAYRDVNRALIERALSQLPSPFYHVDVASGTGLVPQETCALCEALGKSAMIIGLDPDGFALESARKHTRPGPHCSVEFVKGVAQDMPRLLAGKVPPEGVDYTSIHDALHEIPSDDKRGVLAAMAAILKPGGLFTYNSAFTTAAMEESAIQWGRLKAKAFAIFGRKRDRNAPAFQVHSPEEFRQMIVDAGLTVIHEARHSVVISRAALVAICHYPAFIEGVFSDMVGTEEVSLEEKNRVMMQAIEALDPPPLSRIWHEIMAQKVE